MAKVTVAKEQLGKPQRGDYMVQQATGLVVLCLNRFSNVRFYGVRLDNGEVHDWLDQDFSQCSSTIRIDPHKE